MNARPNGINMRYLSVALGRARDENFFKDSFTIRFATFVELLIRMAKIRGVRDGEPPGEGEAEMYRAFLNLFQVCCQKANAFVAAFLNPVCRLLAATRELFTLVTGPKVNHKTRINPTKKRKMVRWWTEKPTQTSPESLTCIWPCPQILNMQFKILFIVSLVASNGLELRWLQAIRTCWMDKLVWHLVRF